LSAWQESDERWTTRAEEWRKVQAQLERERDEYWQMAIREKKAYDDLKVTEIYLHDLSNIK